MREYPLKQFIEVLKDRLRGAENSIETMELQSVHQDPVVNDLLKAIPQAHINELEFVIEQLEEILESR